MKVEQPEHYFSEKYLENIASVFKTIYKNEEFCDVLLCCKDGSLKAHKLILAASSPYFQRIFREYQSEKPIIYLHDISFSQLKHLVDLIYKGNAQIDSEDVDALYKLAKDLEVSGVLDLKKQTGEDLDVSTDSSHNIDTRFKGQKRVAVDFDSDVVPKSGVERIVLSNDFQNRDCRIQGSAPSFMHGSQGIKMEVSPDHFSQEEQPKLSAWAKKAKKFQCELCPSSFKRSSHLSRHQLVHTGERPFACEQCDKAFSRHDKLKHHIRKNHEMDIYDTMPYSPPYELPEQPRPESPPLFTISHIDTILEDSFVSPPAKKGRGRPRKYPPVPQTLIKRGRGRPRIHRLVPEQFSAGQAKPSENYDITNLPYGDIEYLTSSMQGASNSDQERAMVEPEPRLLEPYVEIKTDQNDKEEPNDATPQKEEGDLGEPLEVKPSNGDLNQLEDKIATIGECTISVAN